ncbi:MAG: ACT domain-containing protein [Cellulomonadaceae bacterium]
MSTPDVRWVAFVRGADRTGTLTAITGVFSSRGVNFESLATGDVGGGTGLMIIVFTASERLQRLLARTLARLTAVHSVAVRRADDPTVRAAGVVHMPAGASFAPPAQAAVTWSGDAAAGEPVLLEGQLTAVEQVLDAARAAGAAAVAAVLLPVSAALPPGTGTGLATDRAATTSPAP